MQQKTAKEILREIKRISRLIEQKQDQLRGLHDKMLSISSSANDVVVSGGGPSDKIGRMAVECVALEEEIIAQCMQLELKKDRIIKLIEGLDNIKYSELLYRVYVKQEKLMLAADSMGYSEDWGKQAHRKALIAFEEKYLKK